MTPDERAALEDAALHDLKLTVCGWTSTGPKMLPFHRADVVARLAAGGFVTITRRDKLMDRATITKRGRMTLEDRS